MACGSKHVTQNEMVPNILMCLTNDLVITGQSMKSGPLPRKATTPKLPQFFQVFHVLPCFLRVLPRFSTPVPPRHGLCIFPLNFPKISTCSTFSAFCPAFVPLSRQNTLYIVFLSLSLWKTTAQRLPMPKHNHLPRHAMGVASGEAWGWDKPSRCCFSHGTGRRQLIYCHS